MTADELRKQGRVEAVGNLRGAAWRSGIFLAACLLGAFVLLTVFGQFRF